LSIPPETDYDIDILNSLRNVTKDTIKSLARQKDDRIAAEIKLSRENKITTALIEALPGIFYVFNKDMKMLRWNRNLETISGYTPEEITGMSPLDFFDVKDKQNIERAIKEAFVTGSMLVESEFLSKDWTRHPYLFTGTKVEIENDMYVIGVGLDISERKEMEMSLVESQKELKGKVGYLEKMNKAMVGRELKMVELKRKIRDLEKNEDKEIK
ncbi:MAG: PAS domain S-box protein, partial [Candidatus Omnitrophica bacterium]|nr:PAS domain S-box protein [Candidatus Omnitrophota bacterium]